MSSSPIRIAFAGTPDFAIPTLQKLIEDEAFSVELVITQPDKPVGRKKELTPPPVKVLAMEHGIPVWQPENINEEFESSPHKDLTPDFLVVVAYGALLSQDILDWASIAPVNLHPSLLPRWRGPSPVEHTILHGDKAGGVTVQRIVKKMDAGPILAQQEMKLAENETRITLLERTATVGGDLMVETLKNPLTETTQDESNITVCPLLSRSHGEVSTSTHTAEEIDRAVRALHPWPGITCKIDGETIKLIEVRLHETDESLALVCKDDTVLHVIQIQSPGKSIVSGKNWQKGKASNEE